jgi:predicted O-methyltransferase YrrM
MIRKLSQHIIKSFTKQHRLQKLAKLELEGFPNSLVSTVTYLITECLDEELQKTVTEIEYRRSQIAAGGNTQIPIWYSPKPNSADQNLKKGQRPDPGKTLYFTMKQIANTGKNQKWATALLLMTRSVNATKAIELGSCAGLSARYIASADSIAELVTIEGSTALSKIAKETVKNNKNIRVINALFDDALDIELANKNNQFDLVYIDGHHEKVATIHYFERLLPHLKPGAIVLFDDISWSYDMREAWDDLSSRQAFCHAADFGVVGVCILKTTTDNVETKPKYWNLQPLVGKYKIGKPHGWNK